jgi:hypothetical protein
MTSDDLDSSRRDAAVDEIIDNCEGDARAAIAELLAIVRSLVNENEALREAASPGFARKRPMAFAKSF